MTTAAPAAAPSTAVDGPLAWRMLAALALAELCGMSLWFSATAVTPALVAAFDLGPTTAAWLTVAVQGGFVVGTLATALGNVADVVSARRLMAIGAIAGAAANLAALWVTSPAALVLARALTGAALAWVYPPAMRIVAGWFRTRRGLALGVLVGALTLGKAMPHLVTALFGGWWQASMTFTSALAVVGAVVAIGVVRDGPLTVTVARFDPSAIRRIVAVPGVRIATLGYLGHMWELYAMWAWVAAFAAASFAASATAHASWLASLVAFVAIGSGAIGCVWAGRLADTFGRARVARAAMLASGACCLATPAVFGAHPAWILALTIAWGFSVVADSAQFSALVSEHAPVESIGTALTLQTSLGFLLTMVTIDLLPRAAAVVSWQWACWLLAPGPLLGAWAMRRLTPAS